MTGARRPSVRAQLAAVFRKEVQQTVRDRRIMFLLIAMPLVQTVIFGYAVNFEVDRVATVVVDPEPTNPWLRVRYRALELWDRAARPGHRAGEGEAEGA